MSRIFSRSFTTITLGKTYWHITEQSYLNMMNTFSLVKLFNHTTNTTVLQPFFQDHRVSRCQKRTSGLHGCKGRLRGKHTGWVTQWCNGKAFGLAISRSRVRILREATLHNNLRQVVYTYVPLSPSSITWYRPNGGDALRLLR